MAFERAPALARLEACVQVLPADAQVAADDPLTVPLVSRRSVRELTSARPGDYLVIDREAVLPACVKKTERNAMLAQPGRVVLCDDGRFQVRGPATAILPMIHLRQ